MSGMRFDLTQLRAEGRATRNLMTQWLQLKSLSTDEIDALARAAERRLNFAMMTVNYTAPIAALVISTAALLVALQPGTAVAVIATPLALVFAAVIIGVGGYLVGQVHHWRKVLDELDTKRIAAAHRERKSTTTRGWWRRS